MALEAIHEKLDDIPAEYQTLYTERDGKFELTGIGGIKTALDVERVQSALNKERKDHKDTKEAGHVWGDLKHDDVVKQLDRIPELEAAVAAKGGEIDEEKMNDLVSARIASQLAPIERENLALKKANVEQVDAITGYQAADRTRTIHDEVRKFAIKSEVVGSALDDVLMLADRVFEIRDDDEAIVVRDKMGSTPGVTAEVWLTEQQQIRPHWWPASGGSGAKGGKGGNDFSGTNPWSQAGWNVTKQGQLLRERGVPVAVQMAKSAGSFIGALEATKPAK